MFSVGDLRAGEHRFGEAGAAQVEGDHVAMLVEWQFSSVKLRTRLAIEPVAGGVVDPQHRIGVAAPRDLWRR